MSDNTPSEVLKKPPKKPKLERGVKLPTPPPDPWEALSENSPKTPQNHKSESVEDGDDREVLDYIESLHKNLYSRSSSTFAPAQVTEEAFDHLEKLYKLMEQMLELREQNVRLHRRIRDLEHLNNLEKIHLNPASVEEDYPDLDKDTAFAEVILESILQDPKNKDSLRHKNRSSLLKRHRSCSTTDKPSLSDGVRDEVTEKDDGSKKDKQSKVSKWTKVKAAFRWEKASNVGDSKSQDSGIHVPVNYEIARYLRVPSTSDEMGHSAGDSGAGISTPGSISSASSNDDFQRMGRSACEDLRSSDDENTNQYIPHQKDYRHKSSFHKSQLRNPWAKMKDIIHPRNSLKKKHRLSAASDDIQIDVEFCSDNEDVFESDDPISKSTHLSLSPSPNVCSTPSTSPSCLEVPPEVVERYQRALAEDSASDSEARPSRWSRVRRAFLNRTPKTSCSSHVKEKSDDGAVEEEIKQNYVRLQKKISLEFQDKLSEWERLKQSSPGASSPGSVSGFSEEAKDPAFVKKMEEWQKMKNQFSGNKPRLSQVTREYELPPDFKKKLQEWEKIKKTSLGPKKKLGDVPKWKSLGGPRSSDHPVFEYPALSEEFRKKLEEWKQIKASGGPSCYVEHKKMSEKTPSPKLSRKNSSPKQSKKSKDQNKELHWFEKELGKIEKEKFRLERERQKFIEREERLSKLRKSVLGGQTKKEVLIHTPSGFHRFEGISRKFTQKLYEWEKSQGIAPEASTFALLSSSNYTSEIRPGYTKNTSGTHSASLTRSKSADSIAVSALNLACPLLSGHPSSLSLNDMEELEKECLGNSKTSSLESHDLFLDEPEAVLVEVEDYEEETAEPLHVSCVERQQLPVYQRQEFKPLCESETIAIPKIRRSESARAQTSYDLMEAISKLLTELQVTEDEIRCLVENKNLQEGQNKKTFKFLNELQNQSVSKLNEKLLKLHDSNNNVASNISKDEQPEQSSMDEILKSIRNSPTEMMAMTDQMEKSISIRLSSSEIIYPTALFELIKDVRVKITELRRFLSYVCGSTDSRSLSRKVSEEKKMKLRKTSSNDGRMESSDNSRKSSDKERRFIKMDSTNGQTNLTVGQGAVKKRIRYRQKTLQKNLVDTDDEEVDAEPQKMVRQHKKLTRTRSISDGNLNPTFDDNFLSPGTPNPETSTSESRLDSSPSESAVTLFVKTTRKLFTPLIETSLSKNIPETSPKEPKTPVDREPQPERPPLPGSPVPQRKVFKEVSPSIRLMMAKFNQNALQASGIKSGGSSGSSSPVAWRSPVSERRVKVQTEKYQEEIIKMSPLLGRRNDVEKSSSATTMFSSSKQVTIPARKSSLNNTTVQNSSSEASSDLAALKRSLTLDISLANQNNNLQNLSMSAEMRMRKLQKAKEEFLRTPISAPCFVRNDGLQYPQRNRLSQVSMESETSYDQASLPGALIKSASAGMINIEADAYKIIDPEYRPEGYVSLPRQARKSKDLGKSAFSSIAAKFRKVKMRRGKDKDKNGKNQGREALATLCRQSLVVDISPTDGSGNIVGDFDGESPENGDVRRSSKDSRDSLSKSSSWIKRSLFKR
ncbi:uncharacterized protein LOC115881955 [Sitophilus oryzae]|uniref:Uncharacterized protein LOC115881955 n=1 Tax=Sitophilus oryzae TaxID=7048 RepID=A0A6J2XVL1_SITOR|nr:uncharacterized protein LOC115881955 [Sitophilus oryzae]